jgi:hypothetical protein
MLILKNDLGAPRSGSLRDRQKIFPAGKDSAIFRGMYFWVMGKSK